MIGQVKTGSQPMNVNGTAYTLIGNPYPSAIDFGSLTRSNVSNTFYMWDPKMAGAYGLGGYVTLSWNSNTSSYDKTTSVSPVTQYIQSGEAFFVSSANHTTAGTITIKETDKSAAGSDVVYRSQSTDQRVIVNLFSATNDSLALLDGVLATYGNENQNLVDDDDAKKIYGSNQSIFSKRNGALLAIERRKTITENDTIYLGLSQMKMLDYKLEISMQNMKDGSLFAMIRDNYLNTNNNVALDLDGTTMIPFSVNADAASYAFDRFSIVIEHLRPLPVTFTSIKASRLKKDILVSWKTGNELDIISYDVERSADGIKFTKSTTLAAGVYHEGSSAYSWLDKNVEAGTYYYRIRSSGIGGKNITSSVVKVVVENDQDKTEMVVFPNPVSANSFLIIDELQAGDYLLEVYNTNGQTVRKDVIKQESRGVFKYPVSFLQTLSSNTYKIKLSGKDFTQSVSVIVLK